jgi:WD40 repeat protein
MTNSIQSPPENQPYQYWAFLSFSHQDNRPKRADGSGDHVQWANWLHEQLETFRIPDGYRDRTTRTREPMPERFFPTFRDEAELPSSHDLGGQIRDALTRSRFLIVIASPRSARSRYVNEEVRHFRQLGRDDRILTLIVDGEPNVRLHPKDGWTTDDDCFCPALAHPLRPDGEVDTTRLLPAEPIAADMRVKGTEPPREMHATECAQPDRRILLDLMKLKLIAGLMGVGLDELVQRDKVRQLDAARQRAKALRRWLTVVVILSLLAICGGMIAWNQRKTAMQNERRAVALLKEASRSDFATAQEYLGNGELRWREGMAYLARALKYDPENTDAQMYLWTQIAWETSGPGRLPDHGFAIPVGTHLSALDPTGKTVLLHRSDNMFELRRVEDGQPVGKAFGQCKSGRSFAYSSDGEAVAVGGDDGTVLVIGTQTGQLLGNFQVSFKKQLTLSVAPSGQLLATAIDDDGFVLWDVLHSRRIDVPDLPSGISEMQFDATGQWLALRRFMASPFLVNLVPRPVVTTELQGIKASAIVFQPTTGRLFAFSYDGQAAIYSPGVAKPLCIESFGHQWDGPVQADPDGRIRIVGVTPNPALYDATPNPPDSLYRSGQEFTWVTSAQSGGNFYWDSGARWIAERRPDGYWKLWHRFENGSEPWCNTDPEDWSECALDRAGRFLVEVTRDGIMAVYDLRDRPVRTFQGWAGGPKEIDLANLDGQLVLRTDSGGEPRLFNPSSGQWVSYLLPWATIMPIGAPAWAPDGSFLEAPLPDGQFMRWPVPKPTRAPNDLTKLVAAVCGRSLPPGDSLKRESLAERLRTRAAWSGEKRWTNPLVTTDPEWRRLIQWWLLPPRNRPGMP